MTVHEVRCLTCYSVNHVDFTPFGHAVCPNCGAPGIKLVKLDMRSNDARDNPFARQMRQQ